jgi:hypothetical protein
MRNWGVGFTGRWYWEKCEAVFRATRSKFLESIAFHDFGLYQSKIIAI